MWMPEGQELQKPPLHVVLTQDRKLPRGIQLSSRKLFSAQNATSINSELHNIPCLALHIWLQKSSRIGDFPVQLFADWVRMMPVLAQRVQIEAGRCDVSTLLKLIRNNLLE
jgi:hypothetical protein